MSFVGLHTHSDYSLLDGASQLPDLVARAVELGMPAVAITDHGVMYGAIELLKICRSRQIKPIIGNEMYVMNADVRQQQPRGKAKKYHQIVLAKNTQGYRNLVKLTTVSHLEGFQGKGLFARPCINKELLSQYAEGLIVTSACLGGEIPQNIMKGNLEEARAVASWYKGVFGDDFYLEIQDHGSVEDRVVNVEIVRISAELGIKIIATNDSHFTSCYDVEAHDALLCIQTGKLIFEDNRMRYSGTEYLKSAEEMAQLFRDHLPEEIIREAIANTLEIADKVEPYTNILGEPRIPDFPLPAGHTPATYVDELSQLGMKERFKVASMQDLPLEYRERLKYELEMIDRMGFSTYFLVVWDYIKFARDKNIPVGPGRGSAAGSLVAYALRITNIDPVHHGLLFERFLNPERKSMPDIDTDFCIERRGEVIEYVTDKYGTDRVAQIITFNRMTSKAVLKDTARVLNIPYAESDRMAKMIPVVRGKPTKLKVMISDDTPAPDFKETYETKTYEDPQTGTTISAKQWLDMAMRIEGTNKTFGVHAAGVVISADPLDEIVPLQRNNDGSVITQYFMEDLDSLGLLKMDFLGLKNLTIIDRTLKLIEENPNRPHTNQIDPDEITAEERIAHKILKRGNTKKMPDTVSQTYRTIMNGDLEGVFQLESSGMLDVVSKLKPSCIEDISSILALYRPGPLDAGLIPKFIDRKHGREKIEYEHPDLQPILEETYGVLVYQEQIMKIAQDLGGYSLGQADLLRRAMGKKKPEEMRKQKETFLDGASRKGIDPAVASGLFEQMEKFAEYCFNKSHSTAYGYVTYQTAFLKANYSVEYMAALLTANSDDRDKVTKYLNNCEQTLNIRVQAPDVNRSELTFKPVDNQTILFGLSAIRGVGSGAIESIIAAREEGGKFTSLADFVSRINIQAVNSKALDALIRCGAFDEIENNRRQLINDMELVIKWAQNRAKEKASGQVSLFDLMPVTTATVAKEDTFVAAPKSPLVNDYNPSERLEFEQELLGVYVSDHPLRGIEKAAKRFNIESIKLSAAPEHKNKQVTAAALLTEVKVVQTKKDAKSMAILKLTGIDGYQLSGVIFPADYENNREKLLQNIPALVTGKISRRSQDDEELQIIVSEIRTFDADELAATTTPHTPTDRHVLLTLPLDFIRDPERWKNLRSSLMEYNTDNSTTAIPTKAIVESADTLYHIQFHSRYQIEDPETAIDSLHSQGIAAQICTSTSVLQEETIYHSQRSANDSPQPS